VNVVNTGLLCAFFKKHNQAKAPLTAWLKVTQQASWKHLMDIRQNYPGTDGKVKGVYTVFNIKRNSYRLVTLINYPAQTIAITHVFTHAEYDHWNKTS
jgi:mRNA interferase HigB